jgi:hypothetical protein
MKTLGYIVVVLIALAMISSALDSGEDAKDEASATTSAQPSAAQASPPPPKQKPDTGRMSSGEYALLTAQLDAVDREAVQFAELMPKCAVLFEALQLADASTCIAEAYDGMEDDMLAAYAVADDLEGDVAKACLKALRLYKDRLDEFYTWIKSAAQAGTTLQMDAFAALADQSTQKTTRYRKARDWLLADCEPR